MTRRYDSGGIRSLADAQHGAVGRHQLLSLGVHRDLIARWLERGWLTEVFPHAYAVGHSALTREGRYMAAVLSSGPGAHLSHRAAGALHSLCLPGHIAVTTTRNVTRTAFDVHRVRHLPPEHTTTIDGIPCTTPMRTLADIADTARSTREIERAVDNAFVHNLIDMTTLNPILDARCRRPGAAALKPILATHTPGTTITRSGLEEKFLTLVDAAGLPRPAMNEPLTLADGSEIRPDALWRRQRLIVEVDTPRTHATRFDSDRRRDALLAAAGYTVVRFTARQIEREPDYVVATLTQLLRGTRRAAT